MIHIICGKVKYYLYRGNYTENKKDGKFRLFICLILIGYIILTLYRRNSAAASKLSVNR